MCRKSVIFFLYCVFTSHNFELGCITVAFLHVFHIKIALFQV